MQKIAFETTSSQQCGFVAKSSKRKMHIIVETILKFFGLFFYGDDVQKTLEPTLLTGENGPLNVDATLPPNRHDVVFGRISTNVAPRQLRCVVISDTHLYHESIEIPDGDILFHCGDFGHFRRGTSRDTTQAFDKWLASLPHRLKIVIAGNHDKWIFNYHSQAPHVLQNAVYLRDESIYVGFDDAANVIASKTPFAHSLHVYGHPWAHERSFVYRANAFSLPLVARRAKVAQIPSTVDILLTHTPPYGICDDAGFRREGCLALREALHSGRIAPKVHMFGHCHGSFGVASTYAGTHFINAAQEYGWPVRFDIAIDDESKSPSKRRRRKKQHSNKNEL